MSDGGPWSVRGPATTTRVAGASVPPGAETEEELGRRGRLGGEDCREEDEDQDGGEEHQEDEAEGWNSERPEWLHRRV